MSDVDYSQYYYRPKRERRQTKWWRFLIIFIIAACFVGFILVYNASRGSLADVRLNSTKSAIILSEQFYYAVDMANFQTVELAEGARNAIVKRGGAGYIVDDNGTFRLLASMYRTKESAESVATRLKSAGESCSLFALQVPSCKIKLGLYKSAMNGAMEIIKYFYELADDLEELYIGIDKNKTSLSAATDTLNKCGLKISSLLDNFSNPTTSVQYNSLIGSTFMHIRVRIDEIVTSSDDNAELSIELKYLHIEIIDSFIAMVNKLN